MPTTEGTAEMSLDAADKAAISMVEDHPKNSYQHELKLHALSAKAERLLWHQRLAHCGNEHLCRAHMFSDGVPEMRLGKDSALDSCPVCLAANMKSRNRGDGETRAAAGYRARARLVNRLLVCRPTFEERHKSGASAGQ